MNRMVMVESTKTDGGTDAKTLVVEKRVGSAVIRRRREAPVIAPEQPSAEATTGATAAAPKTAAATSAAPPAPSITVAPTISELLKPTTAPAGVTTPRKIGALPTETEDASATPKAAKPLRRKKSREEWVEDDIRRAGGLRHYAAEDLVVVEEEVPGVAVEGAPEGTPEETGVALEAATEPAAAPDEEVSAAVVEAAPAPLPVMVEPPPVREEFVQRAPAARTDRVFRPTGGMRKKRSMRRGGGETKKPVLLEMKASKRVIRIEEKISISELSQRMGVKGTDLIRQLMGLGIMTTINQGVDIETATLLAGEYGFSIENVGVQEDQLLAGKAPITKSAEKEASASAGQRGVMRPPVVTVMGHVDHGKTSILDAVRKTDVATGEAGGITQHIGASEVTVEKGTITFLDTPGHEAFTSLRARGAKVTDIVVLVVAADDGVMPQTKEAIDHAKAAGVPIIVAVNKMDKPDANPDRVKRQLAENGIVPEDWGGEAPCVPVSAKTGDGIPALLEHILLQAEVLELTADADAPASGTVIEAKLDKGRGPVVTVLVQSGSLRKGTPIVCGTCAGRVRALTDPRGNLVDRIGPGQAGEILGLSEVPNAGDAVIEATDERAAKTVAEARARKLKEDQQSKSVRLTLEDLQSQLLSGVRKELAVIIKSDVQGSAEAVVSSLERLGTEQIIVNVVHHGVGGISEGDVMLAVASKAVIIGFNIAAESKARQLAEQEGVQIKRYKIIYELIDDVKKAMTGLLDPQRTEKILGRAEVREVFNIHKVGTIAGCSVVEGKVLRSARARLLRDAAVIFEGKIASLKRFKDDAREVQSGQECGIGLEGYPDIKPGDAIESFIIEEKAGIL